MQFVLILMDIRPLLLDVQVGSLEAEQECDKCKLFAFTRHLYVNRYARLTGAHAR